MAPFAQAGTRSEERTDYTRDSATARAGLKYAIRLLSMALSYEYEEQDDSDNEREEQFVSIRIIRRF